MGRSNPSSTPSLSEREEIAKLKATRSAFIARMDGDNWSISETESGTRTVDRLDRQIARRESKLQKEPEVKAEPKGRTPSQWEAYDLLSDVAIHTIENPDVCEALMEAAASGDKIGKHAGQGARWTGYLAAVTALRGDRYDDPAVEAAIRVVRSPTSIRAWLRAAGAEVVNG